MTGQTLSHPDNQPSNQVAAQAAANERALLSLANRLNPELTAALLKQGATTEQILIACETVAAHAPKQQEQTPIPQQQAPSSEDSRDCLVRQGEMAGDGSLPAFGGYLGDQFAREQAHGAAVAKAILAKVSLTK